MSTFTSKFKGLPKSAQLRALAGAVIPAKESLPFSRLPEESFERKYLSTVYDILTKGRAKSSRPGQNTLMLDDVQFSVDISNHKIPLLTTRYVPYKSFIVETLWMLSGDTNIRFLKEHGVSIWDDWVEPGTELFETADTFTVQEMQNYLRLCEQATYKGWCDYKSAQVTGRAQLSDIESFLKTIGKGLKDFPCRRLVAGSIGTGAYGAQWRKWKDLRAVPGKIAQMLTGRGSHNHIGLAKFNNATGSADLVSTEVDQISDVIKMLKKSPDSRRIIVSAWNPVQIPDTVLPPCFTPEALVATASGYKPIIDIQVGDEVISGSGLPRLVNQKWVTPYEGYMHRIRVDYIGENLECTPNHPFLVKGKGWTEAKDVKAGDQVAIVRAIPGKDYVHRYQEPRRVGPNNETLVIKDFELALNHDDYFTLGYFLGNGWCSQNGIRVSIAIPHKKKDYILERLRKTIRISEKPGGGQNCSTYETRSLRLINLFRSFGHGASNKCVPQFVFDSTIEAQRAFLEGFVEADGCIDQKNAIVITTTSPSIAYGIQRLALLTGKVASLYRQHRPSTTVIEGRTVNQRDTYSLRIVDQWQKNSTEFDESYAWIAVKSNEVFVYSGLVYNLDVDEDHTYTVNNIVNHNCHCFFQFISTVNENTEERELTLKLTQRSSDFLLGAAFNIPQYAVIAHLVAKLTGHKATKLIYSPTDCHIYEDQLPFVLEHLMREPIEAISPRLDIDVNVKNLNKLSPSDIRIEGYNKDAVHPNIPYPVAV